MSLEQSLRRIKSLGARHPHPTEIHAETVAVLPDGTVLDTDTIVPTAEGLYVLRSSVTWFEAQDGVGESQSKKKIGEVILTKPFFAVRSAVDPATLQIEEALEPRTSLPPMNTKISEEDGGPMARGSREEVLHLYAIMVLLFVLYIVWSKVTRCRVSGR